jgi:hypothetical protein
MELASSCIAMTQAAAANTLSGPTAFQLAADRFLLTAVLVLLAVHHRAWPVSALICSLLAVLPLSLASRPVLMVSVWPALTVVSSWLRVERWVLLATGEKKAGADQTATGF